MQVAEGEYSPGMLADMAAGETIQEAIKPACQVEIAWRDRQHVKILCHCFEQPSWQL